jgi:hypothetical protein
MPVLDENASILVFGTGCTGDVLAVWAQTTCPKKIREMAVNIRFIMC